MSAPCPLGDAWRLALWSVLVLPRVAQYRWRLHLAGHRHADLVASRFYDVAWDGGPIDVGDAPAWRPVETAS